MLYDIKEDGQRIIIFCSDWGLGMMSKVKSLHSDGTFKTSAQFFYQLYIIHSWYKQHMFPSAYVLMTKKSESSYKLVLQELKTAALTLGFELHPSIILTDFELAAINAYKFHFPRASILGCIFHFGQCLYWKIVDLGMKVEYSNDINLRKWFKKVISLGLVPPDKVCDGFEILLDTAPD